MNEKCPDCNALMVERQVKKEGKNKGRYFLSCPKCGQGFKWIEKEEPKVESTNGNAVPAEVWDAKDRRMVRMHTQKVAGELVCKYMETWKGLDHWLDNKKRPLTKIVKNRLLKIAHILEKDVYRD